MGTTQTAKTANRQTSTTTWIEGVKHSAEYLFGDLPNFWCWPGQTQFTSKPFILLQKWSMTDIFVGQQSCHFSNSSAAVSFSGQPGPTKVSFQGSDRANIKPVFQVQSRVDQFTLLQRSNRTVSLRDQTVIAEQRRPSHMISLWCQRPNRAGPSHIMTVLWCQRPNRDISRPD